MQPKPHSLRIPSEAPNDDRYVYLSAKPKPYSIELSNNRRDSFKMGISKWFGKSEENSLSQFPGKRLSIEQILQMENPTEMIIELSYGISDKISRTGMDSLSHAEKVLHHIYWLETEVNNGGFDQFFFNTSGNYAMETMLTMDTMDSFQVNQCNPWTRKHSK
jgi:hypothetical protein